MTSKIITDKQKSALSIDSLLETNLEAVSKAAEALFAVHNQTVDLRPLLGGLRALLAARLGAMVDAAQAHDAELSDDPAALQRRDEAALAVYSFMTRLREALAGVYGASALASLGYSSSTPQDPTMLSAFAKNVLAIMKRGAFPKAIDEDISYNPAKKIIEGEALLAALDASLREVSKEKREADQSLAAKNQAGERYDETFSQVANALVGIFALVGSEDLARKARPSTRRPGQTQDSEQTTP